MNAKDWFSVGVRIVGLLSFGRGLGDIINFVEIVIGIIYSSVVSGSHANTLVLGLFYLLGGLYLMRGAPAIINFAFPNRPNEQDTTES